ncbi:tubulin-binding cofactor B [Dermatophagoides pteronyssinus]|uniref:tubulin-binding cofactor B n=1 Tax=Dermatophagoides pteronyssinus TaxID=6956 RepID=UPI003F67355A
MAQIVLEIQTNNDENLIERRFASEMTIPDLKNRLELITGASASEMELIFRDSSGNLIGPHDDSKCLGDYLVPGGELRLRLNVTDPNVVKLDDLSGVQKFELDDEEYSKRSDSVRAFKMKNKLGRFAASTAGDDSNDDECVEHMKLGDRCEVTVKNMPPRRGCIMYIGKLGTKPGIFVGVRYDEPWGKNNGTFENVRYFECPPNYGSFVKPNLVKVGDFPELDDGLE